MKKQYTFQRVMVSVMLVVLLAVVTAVTGSVAVASEPITVQTIIENDSVFARSIIELFMAVGDVTNDGTPDLVFTKGFEPDGAEAAVFQNPGGVWDSGTLLAGPTEDIAFNPIVAPIRNDGQNWLVYSDHRRGNTGEWLRTHRYSGTMMVENKTITAQTVMPINGDGGQSAQSVNATNTAITTVTQNPCTTPGGRCDRRRTPNGRSTTASMNTTCDSTPSVLPERPRNSMGNSLRD